MPALGLPKSSTIDLPREALLYDDSSGGFWSSLLGGLGAAIDFPKQVTLGLTSGRVPYTEDAPENIREWKDIWGIESGAPVSRLEKAAVWGAAGAPFGPLAAGLFAALSQLGYDEDEEQDLFGTFADLALDPLMYLHFGKLLGGTRVPVPAFSKEALNQVFTKAGTKEFNSIRMSVAPIFRNVENADNLAGAAAARLLFAEAGGLRGAVKQGLVQTGGMRFQLPFSDLGVTIPGTPALGGALARGARKLAPEGLKKGLGIYGPVMRDVRTKFHLKKREAMNKMETALQKLTVEVGDLGLSDEFVRPIGEVISAEPFLGFDDAVAKFMPGATPEIKKGIRKAMKATEDTFAKARQYAIKNGIDIEELNQAAFKKMIIREEMALVAAQQGSVDAVLAFAKAEKKTLRDALKTKTKARTMMKEDVETAVQRMVEGTMKDAQDLLRRGYSPKHVSAMMEDTGKVLDIPGKLQKKSAAKIAIDEEIATLEAQLEGLGKQTSRVVRGIRQGDDVLALQEAKLQALETEKAAAAGYFPLLWDEQGKAMLKKASTNEEYARQLLDVDIPGWFGKETFKVTHPSAPGLPEELSMAKYARRLVEAGIEAEHKAGFTAGHLGTPKSIHEFQRRLRITAKMEVETKAGEKVLKSLGVERDFRSDEFKPVIDGLEYMMGAKQPAHKVRKLLLGIGGRQVKVKPGTLFTKDIIGATAQYYRNLGQPIALKSALDDVVKRFGRRVPKATFDNLAEGSMPGYVRVSSDIREVFPGMQNAILPIEIKWDFERWYRNAMNPVIIAQFFAPYVTLIDYWKQMALAVPAFHARNAQSGIWQGIASGVLRNPWSMVEAAQLLARQGRFGLWGKNGHLAIHRGMLGGKGIRLPWQGPEARMSYDDLGRQILEDGVEGPGFYKYESLLSEADNLRGPKSVTRIDRWLFKKSAQMGSDTEYWLRAGQYIDALKQGFTREEAAKVVAKTHFLYESLAPFESQVLRRYIFPFWSWARFNIPFTLEHMGKNPGLYRLAQNMVNDLRTDDAPKESSLMPDWIRRQMGIPIAHNPETGEDSYFLLGNFWPATDVVDLINDPIRKIVSDITPAIRIPYEQATGKVAGSEWRLERFEGERAEFLGISMEKKDIQLLRAFRWLNEINRMVGTVPKLVAEGDMKGVRNWIAHAALGWKVYVYDREKIARGVIYRNKMEIQRMRGHYIRSFLAGDMENAEVVLRWLAERGISPPDYEDIQAYGKRRESSLDRLGRMTQRVMAGSY